MTDLDLCLVPKKRMSARAVALEISKVEGECMVSKTTAIEQLFKRFNNGEPSLEDQARSSRLLIDHEH